MEEVKILNATFMCVNYQTPGIEFELELKTSDGPQHVVAIVSEVRPLLFDNGLVYLYGKSASDRQVLRDNLPAKTIPESPDFSMDSTTNDPKIIKTVRYFLDAINYRNGARFEEGKPLPKELLS
ncbi:MAG: hypothetical protein LBE98_01620 [Puniceicoccales bacterium]|jgi:hypothetical protein|nr:hypothetical protein [Puniceicoccales bacterium]